MKSSYRRYADVLRLIAGHTPEKQWLLKSPYHMFAIDGLLEVFPDACIIQTHRDPLDAIPSLCNMLHLYRQNLQGEASPREIIGPWQCAHWRRALECIETARGKTPTRFLDVDHRRLLADPIAVVHEIYDYFNLALSMKAEERIRAWLAADSMPSHGKHHPLVTPWGITLDTIRNTFAAYRSKYGFA
jgi:hypothetical protein